MARQPRQPLGVAAQSWWASALGKWGCLPPDFTKPMLAGGRAFGSRDEAARAWQVVRRQVWSTTHCRAIPHAATAFDGITDDGARLLHYNQHLLEFEGEPVLKALDGDRQAVQTFRERDPRGAGDVDDFLIEWLSAIDLFESLTNELATFDGPRHLRPFVYARMGSARKYGG